MDAKNAVAFDLETIGNKSLIPILPEIEVNKTLKDPAKIQADIAKKQADQIEKLGLNPWTSIICAFGWCDGENSGHILLKDEESEADLVRDAWDLLAKYDHFVTFNGQSFDVPVLNAHSLIHRIRTAVKINIKKYTTANHTDIRMILTNWDQFGKGKLDFFLRLFFNIGKMEGIDGMLVQGYWDDGQREIIGQYCEDDAQKTWRLYEHVSRYYI